MKKERVMNIIEDLIGKFLYYDRKEDGDLEVGEIQEMVKRGEISVGEIVDKFKCELEEALCVKK